MINATQITRPPKNEIQESGIYEIINLTTNKVYIGHAKRIRQRWYEHRRDLRSNRHGNHHLQHAWNKYGEHDFVFRKLELTNCDKEILIERERYWCQIKDCHNSAKGYNIEVPGEYKKSKGKQGLNQRKSQYKYTIEYYMNHPKIASKDFTLEERKYIAERFVELRKDYSQVQISSRNNLNNIYAVITTDDQSTRIPILIKETYQRSCSLFIQVDIQTGEILNRFTSRLEAVFTLNISKEKIEDQLELNNFKARSHQSRILHPTDGYILMYEKFYRTDYNYRAAVKVGELIKVVREDYEDTLTRYEFEDLTGKVTDYTWVRLRTISYKEGSASYKGYTLTFLRKSLIDNPKEPQLKTVDLTQKGRSEKFTSKGEIVGLREGVKVETYSSLTEMATILEISYKACTRLLSNSNGITGKKKRKGITYVYKEQFKSIV